MVKGVFFYRREIADHAIRGMMLDKEIEDPRYILEYDWRMIFEKVFVMEFVFQKTIVPVFTVSSSIEHWS